MRTALTLLKITLGLVATAALIDMAMHWQDDGFWLLASILPVWVGLDVAGSTTAIIVRLERRWLVYQQAWAAVRKSRGG